MRPVVVVVRGVLGQDVGKVAWSGDGDAVEAFSSQGADPALSDCVRPGRLRWRLDDADFGSAGDGVEGVSELRVSVADEEAKLFGVVSEVDQQVSAPVGSSNARSGWR